MTWRELAEGWALSLSHEQARALVHEARGEDGWCAHNTWKSLVARELADREGLIDAGYEAAEAHERLSAQLGGPSWDWGYTWWGKAAHELARTDARNRLRLVEPDE